MTEQSQKPRRGNEQGFSLIELMVVVLILAVLISASIPTLLGARTRAQDRGAQSSLRHALTAAMTIHADSQTFTLASENPATGLPSVEPALTYAPADVESSREKLVSVRAETAEWGGAVKSTSGKCFFLHETPGGTRYGTAAGAQPCTGDAALAASDMGF